MTSQGPFFIAEVSSNHAGNLDRCIQFIDIAADIGCDAVKFQLFKIDELFTPEVLQGSEDHRKRRAWELSLDIFPALSRHAHERGLFFSCTPFYMDAVAELRPYVDFYKIASYELLWSSLISACSSTGLPLILSTGMAVLDEVQEAVKVARESGCADLSLLHCVSAYPTPFSECNLSVIETLRNTFGCKSGWSDHTVNPFIISQAVSKWSAEIVEFHIDIEGDGAEFAAGHCWLPSDIERIISASREGAIIDGDGMKRPVESEMVEREWRADPADGLRPLMATRQLLKADD